MATFLQSLLGEDEFKNSQQGARNMGLLQAGLAGLMASGPSLTPTSAGQVLGAAGLSGLTGYQDAMSEAERQGVQGMEMRTRQAEEERKRTFANSLQGVYTPSGQINYEAVQKLIMQFPDLAPVAVSAIKSGARPAPTKPEAFSLMPGGKRFVMGPNGQAIEVASVDQPTDFKLDRSALTMMQNVYGTTDFSKLTSQQQATVNKYQNAPSDAELGEMVKNANQMRFETGINIPVPESKTQILVNLLQAMSPQASETVSDPQASGTQGDFPRAPTALQTEIDKKFAPEFVEWTTGGGSDSLAQLGAIGSVADSLNRGENLTGIGVALQPDMLLAITNPNALQARELVEGVVQRNLKLILGGAFTEKEGEALISRAYNPKLKPEQNAARVRNLLLQMSTAAQQKQAMVDYVTKNGTLRGYTGKTPSINDFYKALEVTIPATSQSIQQLEKIFPEFKVK